jgi:hypothetical protein
MIERMRLLPPHQARDRIVNEISDAFLLVIADLFPVVSGRAALTAMPFLPIVEFSSCFVSMVFEN